MTIKVRFAYHFEGIVQGVGFRPFIYTLATRYALSGFVYNSSNGVDLEIEGDDAQLELFEKAFFKELPPLARIDVWDKHSIAPTKESTFQILQSHEDSSKSSPVLPDMSLCVDCEKEFFDVTNRRYGYPFINCTNCGPRYSIIKTVPYDRPYTSMSPFVMCEECESEYKNPLNRRYHAQPISCEKCGPTLFLRSINNELIATNKEAISLFAKLIKDGHIVAMKGMGGFHLMCDATNNNTLATLRIKKNRPDKPFAVMFKNLEAVSKECELSASEKNGVTSLLRPIVLLKRKNKSSNISQLVAPNIDRLGVFLPYTPLHVALFEHIDMPIVATSANHSGEPIIFDANLLREKLSSVVEYYLDYNREIVNSSDDSVVQFIGEKQLLMRSSRGIAPQSFRIKTDEKRSILALGAHQKNAVAIYINQQIIVSPYIGDLDNIATYEAFVKTIEALKRFYGFEPELIVCDLHPNYVSTKYAKEQNIPLVQIQHHYAHILSTMCEFSLKEKVLGIAWDGTGYGEDRTIWGGEFLLCDDKGFERVGYFEPFLLLGGEASIKDIRRILASLLWDILGDSADEKLLEFFNESELKSLKSLYNKKLNAPLCSSVGRLFDAVALLCGMPTSVSYDGQSGLFIEGLYDGAIKEYYEFEIEEGVVRHKKMFASMLHEKEPRIIASKFINTLVQIALKMMSKYPLPTVLAGGVFQNRTLMENILKYAQNKPYFSQKLPINDGSICVGQIYKILLKQN